MKSHLCLWAPQHYNFHCVLVGFSTQLDALLSVFRADRCKGGKLSLIGSSHWMSRGSFFVPGISPSIFCASYDSRYPMIAYGGKALVETWVGQWVDQKEQKKSVE